MKKPTIRIRALVCGATRDNHFMRTLLDKPHEGQNYAQLLHSTKGIKRLKFNHLGTIQVGQRVLIRDASLIAGSLIVKMVEREPNKRRRRK